MLMHYLDTSVFGADVSEGALQRFKESGGTPSTLEKVMSTCDVVIATTGVPGLIEPEMVRKGQIILALSNPHPEIEPKTAEARGAAFATDGKSVNNILGFPGIFRGAVDAGIKQITGEMFIGAAKVIAESAGPGELVPSPLDLNVHRGVAKAVARVSVDNGLNTKDLAGYFD